MKKKIGNTIRTIRRNKNVKTKNLISNIITESAYYKFERGESDTSLITFINLLDRLNIKFSEFNFIMNNYNLNDRDKLSSNLFNAYYFQNKIEIEKVKNQTIDLYEKTNNTFYLHISLTAKLLYYDYDTSKLKPNEIEIIKQHFLTINNYSFYDFSFFANILPVFEFDYETTMIIADKLLKYLKKYEDYSEQSELYITLIQNLCQSAIKNDDKSKAEYYLVESMKYIEKNFDIYAKMTFLYNKSVFNYIFNNDDLTGAYNIINMLNNLGYKELALLHEQELTEFKQKKG